MLPATIENVAWLLDQSDVKCRYNEVKKYVEVEIAGLTTTVDNRDNVTVTHILSLASRAGMATTLVPSYVNAIADKNAYNPAADWIRSRPWDGVDRLPDFYATVQAQADYPEELKCTLLLKWLRSAAAAVTVPGFKGRGVLTLQGEQGLGKTSWTKALVSDPVLRDSVVKLDQHLDAGNKDDVTTAISHWVTEIGELDSSLKRDVARLKGFLTRDFDIVRRPYDRRNSEYPRRTVFIATVNDDRFLVDTTGNSRFWTIACASLDYQHTIDMQQVFAQVASEVKAGETWWLSRDEEAALAAWNTRHQAVSVIAEALYEAIDHDRIGEAGLPFLNTTQVLQVLGHERPTNPQSKECTVALRDLLGPSRRVRGSPRWRVPLREATAADLQLDPVKAVVGASSARKGPTVDPGEIF